VSRRRSRNWQPPIPAGSGRATVEQCEELHGLVCDVLLNAVRHMQDTGEIDRGVLAVAVAFLKLADVCAPAVTAKQRDELLEAMPDFGDSPV
jgi:hypothetical protein